MTDSLGDSGGTSSLVTVGSEFFYIHRLACIYDILLANAITCKCLGGDTKCLPQKPSVNITLTANHSTSETLTTCDPLGLQVSGGQEPYNLTLAEANSAVVSNITLGPGNDGFTWPSFASPSGQMIGE